MSSSSGTPAADGISGSAAAVVRAQTFRRRVALFRALVDEGSCMRVDLTTLRRHAFEGIPDAAGLRAVYWKLLLGYLPPDRACWDATLAERRAQYRELKRFLFADPHSSSSAHAAGEAAADHPLSTAEGSQWSAFFADRELLDVITRDVQRTQVGLQFFGSDPRHAQALRDVLFVYARVNTATRYVQGFNEVLAPLLFVLATDPPCASIDDAEADAFGCFTSVMAEAWSDSFCRKLDGSMLDSHCTVGRFHALLAALDPPLFRNLAAKNLDPRFYGFRWLSLLFSQEFALPDVLRLWDSLFADEHRPDFLLFFACAAVILHRDRLLAEDFSENLQLLQNLPPTDVGLIIRKAVELRDAAASDILEPHNLSKAVARALGKDGPSADELLRAEEEELKRRVQSKPMPIPSSSSSSPPTTATARSAPSPSSSEQQRRRGGGGGGIPGAFPWLH